MHEVLDDLSKAINGLDALSRDKSFQNEEWSTYLTRKMAQLQQIHGQLGYSFLGHPSWTSEKPSNDAKNKRR